MPAVRPRGAGQQRFAHLIQQLADLVSSTSAVMTLMLVKLHCPCLSLKVLLDLDEVLLRRSGVASLGGPCRAG